MQSLYYVNPMFAMMMIKPFTPLRNEDGSYNLIIPENAYSNPRASAEYDDQWEKQYKLGANVFLEYNIIKGSLQKPPTVLNIPTVKEEGTGVRKQTTERQWVHFRHRGPNMFC